MVGELPPHARPLTGVAPNSPRMEIADTPNHAARTRSVAGWSRCRDRFLRPVLSDAPIAELQPLPVDGSGRPRRSITTAALAGRARTAAFPFMLPIRLHLLGLSVVCPGGHVKETPMRWL